MKKGASVFLVLLVMLTAGCNTAREATPDDFVHLVESPSAGLRKEITVGNMVYEFQYKPASYIALKEYAGRLEDTLGFRSRLKQLAGTAWFNVAMRARKGTINPVKKDVSGLEEYGGRLNYFMNEAQRDFSLRYGDREEMPLAGYFFENNYGLTPMDVMIVGFVIPDSLPREDIVLSYSDKLFDNGIIKVRVTKEDLQQLPTLKF